MSIDNITSSARPKGGRPLGSKNKIPSKSVQAQQRFAELVLPQIERYFAELDAIATDRNQIVTARITAIRELLDRGLGKPQQNVDLTVSDAVELSPEDVLAAWDEPEAEK